MYLPYWRLDRAAIGEGHGAPAGVGSRAVAAFDEDSTSMGVEACRLVLRTAVEAPGELWFATTSPAYADKTNATAIHAALGLAPEAAAYDVIGSVRSGLGALRAASGLMVVVSRCTPVIRSHRRFVALAFMRGYCGF